MDPTTTDETWRPFTDPHGYFRIEIPNSWRVEQTGGPRFLRIKGVSWTPHSFMTRLTPVEDDIDINTRRIGMTIRIDQYAETPPSIKGHQDPTDLAYIRTYRIVHDSDWLVVSVGHLRIDIQYVIGFFRGVGDRCYACHCFSEVRMLHQRVSHQHCSLLLSPLPPPFPRSPTPRKNL